MAATLLDNTLVPTWNDKDANGNALAVKDWRPLPCEEEWNEIVDREVPFGLRGSAMKLELGRFLANENLRIARAGYGPHMAIQGQGREQSMVQAGRDFGPGQYLVGGGDKLKGSKVHYRDFGVSGPVARTPALGTAPCQMSGIRLPGGETVASMLMASYLNVGVDISSDHVYVDRLKAVNCLVGVDFGLDERQEASHYLEILNLTENLRCGMLVRRSNVAGGAECHTMHVGMEPIGIELEALLGLADYYEDNPMGVGGVKFHNLMVESPGNCAIYGPTRNVLGNDFGVIDVVGSYGGRMLDLDLGIAGVKCAFAVVKEWSGNSIASTSWLTTVPPGTGPYIICDGGSNNSLIAPNIGAALKDNKPIFGPADGHRTPYTNYEMGLTDTVKGHTGRLTKASVAVKRYQLVQLAPQGRGVVPHQGTGAEVYGTMGQAGVKDDFLVCFDRREHVAGIPILCDDTSVQGGSPVKPDPSGGGRVVACSATDSEYLGDATRSPSGGSVPVVYADN